MRSTSVSKVVEIQAYVSKHVAAFDARARANAAVSRPGERVAQHDKDVRAARFLGRDVGGRPLSQSAKVLDLAYGRYAAQVGALVSEGKFAEAFGLVFLHNIETTELPAHVPYVDESHTLRVDARGNPL